MSSFEFRLQFLDADRMLFASNPGVAFACYFSDPDGQVGELNWPTEALESYR